MATTPSPALIKDYGGTLAAQYAQELSDLEASLDIEWPTWQHPEPKKRAFRHLPFPAIGRIKLLLKRRQLILRGKGEYGVRLAYKRTGKGEQGLPFAILVKPQRSQAEQSEAAAQHHLAHINIAAIAEDLDLPIEKVEAAIPSWRGVVPIREHVKVHASLRTVEETSPTTLPEETPEEVTDASA